MSTLTLTRSPRYIRSTTFSNAIKVKLEFLERENDRLKYR